MRRLIITLVSAGGWLAMPNAIAAQSRDTASAKARPSGTVAPTANPACCAIVRIESARSLVTARETATGFTFRFAVKSKRLLATLKIGQPVWADFAAKTVKLKATDATPCCAIVETPPPPKPRSLGENQSSRAHAAHELLTRGR